MSKIKRSGNSVRNIAMSAIGYKYNFARRLRKSMAISFIGSNIAMVLFNRVDTEESRLLKYGMIATWGLCLAKSIIDDKRISRDMDRYDELFEIIGRNTDEVISIDDIKRNVCRIGFSDDSYIEESIKKGVYSCTYNKGEEKMDITNQVKQLVKTKKEVK